jgi:hypothetical protein
MKKQDITKNEINSLRQYRSWAYWSAIVSFLVLVLFIVLRTLKHTKELTLFSDTVDTIIYEVATVSAATFLATALIGIIYEKFQTKIVHDDSLVRERFIDEGILKVYKSSTDAKLLEFMLNEITNSKSEVIAVGLGLGILFHNYQLLDAIAQRLNTVDHYRLKIFVGSPTNNGVKNRVREEKLDHKKNNLNYDGSWINRYRSEISGVLQKNITPACIDKFTIKVIDTCPMVSVIKIDDHYLFFPYGTPNLKGSHSPWILIDGCAEGSAMVKFLKDIIKFYE